MTAKTMTSRPNIVFLFPDQLRRDFLSCYGAGFIQTPNVDWIAERGIRYDNAYSASPLCVPARTALLTGMSALRNGVTDNLHALRPDYNEAGIRTWPQILSEAGYFTSAVGKMHFYPWDARHGFRHRVACEDKLWAKGPGRLPPLPEGARPQEAGAAGVRRLHREERGGGHGRSVGALVGQVHRAGGAAVHRGIRGRRPVRADGRVSGPARPL